MLSIQRLSLSLVVSGPWWSSFCRPRMAWRHKTRGSRCLASPPYSPHSRDLQTYGTTIWNRVEIGWAVMHFVGVTAMVGCAPTFSVLAARCRPNITPITGTTSQRCRSTCTTWSAYEAGLRRRGSLTLWIEDAALEFWQTCGPGGQARHSDAAGQTSLMMRTAFKLPLRQTEGLLAPVLTLMDLTISAPGHTTVSCRAVNLPVTRAAQVPHGPMHVLIDSTGLRLWNSSDAPSHSRHHQIGRPARNVPRPRSRAHSAWQGALHPNEARPYGPRRG
jgi:Transposase DDE domain